MKSANLSVVKDDLSGFVERARRGQVVRILVRGRPAADLVPIAADDADDESARMAALERAGVLRRARRPMTDDVFKKGPRPRRGGSIVDALLPSGRVGGEVLGLFGHRAPGGGGGPKHGLPAAASG